MAQFAVEVGQIGLRAGQQAHGEIAHGAQALGQDAQGGTLAGAGIARGQGEAAFADLLFDAPTEVLDRWRDQKRRGGDVLGEGVELEAVEVEKLFVHEGFSGLGR